MAKKATKLSIIAILVGCSPLLLLGSEGGMQTGWVFLIFTIPVGIGLGLWAFFLAFVMSIKGIARSRGTSTSHLIIAIAALVLLLVPAGIIPALLFNWLQDFWLLIFPIAGLVGFVLAIVTGYKAPPEKVATQVSGT